MRRSIFCSLAVLAVVGTLPGIAMAGSKVVTHIRTYDIEGESGKALIEAMDKSGPKHGFLTRAIAQTSYTVEWDFDLKAKADVCHLRAASATLDMTYMYPRVTTPMSPALRKRWQRFFAGVRAHEQTHGRIARQGIAAGERAVASLAVANDPHCIKTQREAQRRVDAIYDEYEAKQVVFDQREHREGGRVEALVAKLVKDR
ncbi:DUF922 domain-containing protein [Mesorhizobium sp. 1M-11]|uniref:DUF922 domain-containing protein n=1 Tax=Mesorhizobium sp. 1M-11 TaxID=1529006 RepID=UPI0006C76FF0|nr:DUF922 domain-containing protein [Mesorhizobium sp. 1M-11]